MLEYPTIKYYYKKQTNFWGDNMNKTIEKTKILMTNNDNYIANDISKIWPITNENLKEVYNIFNIKNKNILTITSSGDHILESMISDAKIIDSFDINYLTKYYYHLKKAIIQNYDLENFLDIIRKLSYGFISNNDYSTIRKSLSKEAQLFWDTIINCYHTTDNTYLRNLFNTTAKKENFDLVNYLTPNNYKLLKEKLNSYNVSLIHSDIFSLDNKLDKTYDLIYLSNIYKYTNKFNHIGLNKVKEYAKTKLFPHLNEGGTIVYAYLYGYAFDHFNNLYMLKDNNEISYPIDGTYGKKDCLFTLKK